MRAFLTLHDPATAAGYRARGLWHDDTFYSLAAAHAARRPDALALRDGRDSWSWREVVGRADALAGVLRGAGLTSGDRVSLRLSNRAGAVVAFLACAREGYACNPSLHRTHTCAEVGALLERLQCAAFISEAGWGADRERADLDGLLAGLPRLRLRLDVDHLPGPADGPGAPADNADAVAYMAFTSGTTGTPKCVMHSANTLLANARDMARDWALGHDTIILSLSPLSHHIAWVGVSQWLLSGGVFVTDDPPAGCSRLEWLERTGATYVMGVPTHAMDLLAEQRAAGTATLGRVRTFYMAGSAIAPSVAEAFVAQGIMPQNVYGMTENSSHQYTQPDDRPEIGVRTCGRGGPAYEVRIFDPEDRNRVLGPDEVGEIGGRGAALMLGYFANQSATADSFNDDGWFLSGDLGALDEQGNLHVIGRLKDLIIRGGHNIHPSHIEALALRHRAVEKCAVVPVYDARLGERVCITLIGNLDAPSLLAHLYAEGLSVYDMPEYYLEVAAYPLTASGKILKRELIDMLKRGELKPTPVRFVRDGPGYSS